MKYLLDVKLGINVANEVVENDDIEFDEAVKDGRVEFELVNIKLYNWDGKLISDADFKEVMMPYFRDMVEQMKEGL